MYYSPNLAIILTVIISVLCGVWGWYLREAKYNRDKAAEDIRITITGTIK